MNPLRPAKLSDLVDDVFLKHDLNIYNFIIEINRQLNARNWTYAECDSSVSTASPTASSRSKAMPNRRLNFLDLESAIEIYTPMYQLLLTDSDFWRACNSLQLDEDDRPVCDDAYQDHRFLGLVNNRHPIISESVLGAAHRLMLHGLAVELLHAYLVKRKRQLAGAIFGRVNQSAESSSEARHARRDSQLSLVRVMFFGCVFFAGLYIGFGLLNELLIRLMPISGTEGSLTRVRSERASRGASWCCRPYPC